ncbi:nuclear transport factor 2 family protein [Chryseobacterium sp. MIQD13]|uniref:nuclear transport factor 2 family protein n=1 Tax=Chryseobacterium sp. MIQD13 TaxID=3422310 RepID=UPI003D27A495
MNKRINLMFKPMKITNTFLTKTLIIFLISFILFSCENNDDEIKTHDTNQANIQTVNTMFTAFGKGDIDGMQKTVSDNTIWNYNGAPPIPYTGTYTGKAGVADFVNTIFSSVEIISFKVNKIIAGDNNTVVVLGEETQKIKSNGKLLTQTWVQVYTVENGLITRMEEYANTAVSAKLFQN